ncbi:MAG: leucine-rich repeat domain-containing protein [Pirellulales bacterium]
MRFLPPRRWFQFRLRTLLVVVGVCAPVFGWFANGIDKVRRQRAAIKELETFQIEIEVQAAGPAWLQTILGDNRLVTAHTVVPYRPWCGNEIMNGPAFSAAQLPLLDDLIGIESLDLGWLDINDAGLEHVVGHASLVELRLCGITERGPHWRQLAACTNLHTLALSKTNISDGDLAALGSLSRLRTLYLIDTRVTGEGLKALAQRGSIEELSISDRVNGAGLRQIGGLTGLRVLSIRSNAITDGDLAALNNLQHIERLDITSLRIAGSGLRHLGGLPQLKSLSLEGVPLEGNCLKHVGELPALEALLIDTTFVNDNLLHHLPHLPRLMELSLNGSVVSDEGLAQLALKLPALRHLEVNGSHVTSAGLVHLLSFPSLDVVTLYGTRTTHLVVERVRVEARQRGRSLTIEIDE